MYVATCESSDWRTRYVPKVLLGPIRYWHLRSSALVASLKDLWVPPEAGEIPLPLPPPLLRYRVHGQLDSGTFVTVGRNCARDLMRSFMVTGKDLYALENILDFGCGCARVLRHFHDHPESCHFFGTDIDPEAISWCRSRLPFATFGVNDRLPPLPFPAETFDLIYGVSVFTHLDEDYQLAWLNELRRVTKHGGTLMLSLHGAYAQGIAAQQRMFATCDLETLQDKGFLFQVLETGRFKRDGLPDFYQCAFHTEPYVRETWSEFFAVQDYVERGINNHQDLVVLTRR
jgi:SAM-dependent methyltransferase